ncbi:MAG: hypothetical protein M3253_07350 [Chloroflexota bacterium]|nr:hypothetical protein [Chloroflexota bacterium]
MRTRFWFCVVALAMAGLVAPATVMAGQPVDGTTLTPPVAPGTPCFQDGRWVRCDTSNVTSYTNQPGFDLSCGTIYETGVDDRHATRWYEDGLLVKRSVQASFRGFVSLSPTGDAPRVGVYGDWNWWIRLEVPGDESTGVLTSHGNGLRVAGMRSLLRDTGIWLPDGTHHGLFTFTDEGVERLCELLAG